MLSTTQKKKTLTKKHTDHKGGKKIDSYLWLENFGSYVAAYITHVLVETLQKRGG